MRIDVDTFRGTRDGVPNLLRLFDKYSVPSTFFFSVGPDNMGRHIFRLLKPAFFTKMLRSRAASLYGWDIIFKGTLGKGPLIGKRLGKIIRDAKEAGHEIGLHAWDHYSWQAHMEEWSSGRIFEALKDGVEELGGILGEAPSCSAVPGWKANDAVLAEKAKFPFRYNSDCRGESVFVPVSADGKALQPQVPSTLPTYDEVIGNNGITAFSYNEFILSQIRPRSLNILTIHAETEGIACVDLFEDFLKKSREREIAFVPLSAFIPDGATLPAGRIIQREIPGREGVVAVQMSGDAS